MNCNWCGVPVDGFEVETDDPDVGWCSIDHYERDTEEPYMLVREYWREDA